MKELKLCIGHLNTTQVLGKELFYSFLCLLEEVMK
jgi:hypothetical protein